VIERALAKSRKVHERSALHRTGAARRSTA
jgi:hypothetical protein